MTVRPQAASPVTNPRTLTLTGVFSGVQNIARSRLDHTISGLADHSRLPNTIAQGPATLPQARLSNTLVAEVRSFRPGPGIQPARQNVLNIQNDPGRQADGVIRALQRYFDVHPRRQPSADPRDEASTVRHPQGIIPSSARWSQDLYYQFADNGVATYQIQPDYRAWGGRLDLELTGAGQTTVSAPATRAPRPGASPTLGYYDPANAAQKAQARTTELLTPNRFPMTRVGPPNIIDNPYFDSAFAGENTVRKIKTDLTPNHFPMTRVGPPNIVDNPYFDSAFAGENAAGKIKADLTPNHFPMTRVGPPNIIDNPYFDSAFAGENAAGKIKADLAPNHFPMTRVGPPNIVDNPYFNSAFAGENAVSQIRADLTPRNFPMTRVGPPNIIDNPYFNSAFAGENAVAQIQADLATGGRTPLSPINLQANRAEQIRDSFIRTSPTLSDWS